MVKSLRRVLRPCALLTVLLPLLLTACLPPVLAPAPLPETPPEAAGLNWRECPVEPEGEGWKQAEACFGHPWPVLDEIDRAHKGERTTRGYRLKIGQDLYETREHALPLPISNLYTLTKNGRLKSLLFGEFSTYSPDLGLADLAGTVAWTFDDGHRATVVYGGADLRRTHKLDAAFAPYVLADKLIFVGHRDDKYFVIYDGQRVGPVFDSVLIAHCCEPAMYSARGGSGSYVFWGQRDDQHYVVEISAQDANESE